MFKCKNFRSKIIRLENKDDYIVIRSLLGKKIISKKHISVLDYSIFSKNYGINNSIKVVNTRKYKTKVSVQGFCSSGSTVVIDLLREFDNTTCIAGVEFETDNVKDIKTPPIELDFYRHLRLYELENIINLKEFEIDNIIKKLIFKARKYLGDLQLQGIFNCNVVEEFNKMLFSMLEPINFKLSNYKQLLPVTSILQIENNIDCLENYVFYKIKNSLTKDDIKNSIAIFIKTILESIDSNEILLLDQFLGILDNGFDIDFHKQYVGNIKQIAVYRDPRDQFMTNWLHTFNIFDNSAFMQIDNIEYYLNVLNKYKISHQNRLFISFESLINDYENSVNKICNFLGIDKSHHINKFKHFNPEISKKNIGIYKNFYDQKLMQQIYENFKEYCYER